MAGRAGGIELGVFVEQAYPLIYGLAEGVASETGGKN